ncbi:MAG: NfeD family protein [Dehalococcoidales bacterium]
MSIIIGNILLEIDLWLVILLLVFLIAFIIFAVNRGIVAHRFRIAAGSEDLVGKTAEVKTTLEPRGLVFVEGERWSAIAEDGRVEPGEEVIINRVTGLVLYVSRK